MMQDDPPPWLPNHVSHASQERNESAWQPQGLVGEAPGREDSRESVAVVVKKCPSAVGNGLVGHALGGLAWCETFAAVGLHCFWVLSKSSPLTTDNAWGPTLALVPFALMLLAGLASTAAPIRAILARLEAALHWTACLLQALLLFWVVLQNPVEPIIPLASSFFLWSVALGFVLLANLATQLRGRAAARSFQHNAPPWLTVALALLWWGATLWLASGMVWAVYFWTASCLLHAILAAAGPRETVTEVSGTKKLVPALETALLLCLLALLQVQGVFCNAVMGPVEAKYLLFLASFYSLGFFAGAALFLLALRFRLTAFTHAAMAVFLVAVPGELLWPSAVGFGYALPALFRATRRLGGLGYTLSAVVMVFLWIIGQGGFAFAGLAVHFGFYLEEVHLLLWGLQGALGFLLVLWLAVLWFRRNRKVHLTLRVPLALPGLPFCAALFALLFLLAFLPGALLLGTTAWPPAFMKQPSSISVDYPMGLCHAGSSESDDEYKVLNELGVQSFRVDFTWSDFQPAPGQWNFACRNGYVATAKKYGKRVVAILDYDNAAVEEDPAGKARTGYIAPADLPKFMEYVHQVVTHFSGSVDAWEIWNEPDISRFWDGPMEEFYALARQTADAIRIADPAACIVGPACTGPLGTLMAPAIEGLHASRALLDVQHPSGHLYTTHPRHYYAEFMRLIGMARRYAHPGTIWLTELGAPDGGYYPWCADSASLAEYVIKAYTIATSLGIERVFWYCFRDGTLETQSKRPPDSEAFFGLLGPGDQWKPSAHAYRLFSTFCSNSTLRKDLVQVSGGLAARQVRTAFYRHDNDPSALILWFEPSLFPWGTARATIDVGGTNEPPVLHDIGSGYAKPLFDDHVDLTETPVFVTFNAGDNPEKTIHITVCGSPLDLLWLVLVGSAVPLSLAFCLHRRMRPAGMQV